MDALVALVLYGFLALLVAIGAYYVVRRAVRDELRDHDAEIERRDAGRQRD